MNGLAFAATIVDALVWPLTIIFVVLLLKKPISGLISRIRSISHNGTRLDLDPLEQLQEHPVEPVQIDERAEDAIRNDPRAAVIEAWLRFELVARETLAELGIRAELGSMRRLMRALNEEQLLQGNLYELIMELRKVRNQAAHDLDITIDSQNARQYVELTERASALLRENAGRHSQ
ncbi:MAG: DUF4145 domain-containing protein [Chloroflexi bacterium]|nr:DUF4145 domain-containing protein [Chloroflexota bacterium]